MEINIIQILEALGLIIAGATILARLTPTMKDDNFLEKVRNFLERVGNIFLPNIKK